MAGTRMRTDLRLLLHALLLGVLAAAGAQVWLVQWVRAAGVPPMQISSVPMERREWKGVDLLRQRPGSELGKFPAPLAGVLVPKFLVVFMVAAGLHFLLIGTRWGGRPLVVLWALATFLGQVACVCLAIQVASAYRATSTVLPELRYWVILAAGFLVPLLVALPLVASFFIPVEPPARSALGRWTAAGEAVLAAGFLWIVGMRHLGPLWAAGAMVPWLLPAGAALRPSVDFLLGRWREEGETGTGSDPEDAPKSRDL